MTPRRWLRAHHDVQALIFLISLTLLTAWNRIAFDGWLPRFDLFTQIIPWYAYLGKQMRAGEIPGWNPYQGAAHPSPATRCRGGCTFRRWRYSPFFRCSRVSRCMPAADLMLASASTYAFARVLGLRIVAALIAAIAFAFGPFLEWTTYSSLQFAQFAVWVPVAFLGIEMAMQRRPWRARFLPWCIGAFAFSQMLAGWVGRRMAVWRAPAR